MPFHVPLVGGQEGAPDAHVGVLHLGWHRVARECPVHDL
jgi:hypothetical protein